MRLSRLWYALSALLIAGCGTGSGSGGGDCTLIGGDSGVHVRFDDSLFTGLIPDAGRPFLVRLCAERICEERTLSQPTQDPEYQIYVNLDENIGAVTVPVQFTVTTAGRTLYDTRSDVKLRKTQPNGEGCSPTLYQAGLTADPERGLVER